MQIRLIPAPVSSQLVTGGIILVVKQKQTPTLYFSLKDSTTESMTLNATKSVCGSYNGLLLGTFGAIGGWCYCASLNTPNNCRSIVLNDPTDFRYSVSEFQWVDSETKVGHFSGKGDVRGPFHSSFPCFLSSVVSIEPFQGRVASCYRL